MERVHSGEEMSLFVILQCPGKYRENKMLEQEID